MIELMPHLANGWIRQRGNVFGFGDFDPSSPQLLEATSAVLNKAPVRNIPPEVQVGFINYEVGIRGVNQLRCASAANVKSKSQDLVELQPSETYKAFQQPAGKLNSLITEWKKDQAKLIEQNINKKEAENLQVDKRKNLDLIGGPFTTADDVDKYMMTNISGGEKVRSLYLEVRYQRDACVSLPKNSDIFRLKR